MVIATQNPVEYHGTYPLPESQLDRFLLRIQMGYPDETSEREILRQNGRPRAWQDVTPVASGHEIVELQELVGKVRVEEAVVDYLMAIVAETRRHQQLALGASPRGSMALYRVAQALALVEGLDYCTPHHVKRLVIPVFAHRLVPEVRFGGNGSVAERSTQVLETILQSVEVPL
jgi:MoxR-like ATPase